jgi:hypothetical protein
VSFNEAPTIHKQHRKIKADLEDFRCGSDADLFMSQMHYQQKMDDFCNQHSAHEKFELFFPA